MSTLQVKVALSDECLTSVFDLPRDIQKKTMNFFRKFRDNPRASGINYEKIIDAADPNMRSVKIDLAYRAIVLKPSKGNVYVLLHVAHHDNAYDWATRKKVQIHPDTGTIQVLTAEVGTLIEPSEVEDTTPSLFAGFRDRELARFGTPEGLMFGLRDCKTMEDFKRFQEYLPAEAYEALYWLANGDSIEEVYRALMMPSEDVATEEIDVEDIEAALERPGSQRHFKILTDDLELEKILLSPLERWRIFLHPVQRKLVDRSWNGPARVLGGAGTGKTVVAMHRAKWLAENFCTKPNERVLFTTYTRNLSDDIEHNLRELCDPDTMRKIEVVNLDRWVSNFLKKQGYPNEIKYFQRKGQLAKLWERAMLDKPEDVDVPESFYREEWERVVQDSGCETMRDYFKASRVGRGVALHRSARKKVWAVFESYRSLMAQNSVRESSDAMRDAEQILRNKGNILPYRSIVVDEAQDFGSAAYRLLRQIVATEEKNDIFVVGDAHQRIYGRKVVMSRCGVHIVGRSRRLRINYRTTDEIRKFAVGVLKGISFDDLDGGEDSVRGYTSLMYGDEPRVESYDSVDAEIDAIADFIGTDKERWTGVCVTARTQKLVDTYQAGLKKRGIETYKISRKHVDDRNIPGVRLATMHRVKGLEFGRVVVAGANAGTIPLKVAVNSSDESVREAQEAFERSLFYVALTRAKSECLITSSSTISPFVENLKT